MTSMFGGRGTKYGPIAPAFAPGDVDGVRRAMTLFGAWLRRLRSAAVRSSRAGGSRSAMRRSDRPGTTGCASAADRGIAGAPDGVHRPSRAVVPALVCLALLAGVATPASAQTQTLPTVSFGSWVGYAMGETSKTVEPVVRLSEAPATDITFAYWVGGTATSGSDFTVANSRTVTAPKGATKVTIPVTIIDDGVHESRETIILTLAPGEGYRVGGTNSFYLDIFANDEPAVSFASASQSTDEGAGTRDVGLTLDNAPIFDITFAYTVGGTATPHFDYAALSGTVTVPKGATTATIPVTLFDDTADEFDETIVLTIDRTIRGRYASPPWCRFCQTGSLATHTLSITDNDTPLVSFVSASQSVDEGAGTHDVEVRMSQAPPTNITFAYTVGGTATPGSDYAALYGTVTVPGGATTATVPVTVIDDSALESSETVVLTLVGSSGYKVGSPGTHTLTIAASDPTTTASFASASQTVDEGAGTRNVEVTLDEVPASDITLAYTVGGTATAGSDYTALSGTVTVSKGATTATIPVAVIDDGAHELDETVVLTLVGGTGYKVGGSAAHTLTIAANDTPTVSFASASQSAGEGAGKRNVKVTLDTTPAPGTSITFAYTVADGTATSGSDYTAVSSSASWTLPHGVSAATIPVTIIDDSAREGSETVVVKLIGCTGAVVGHIIGMTLACQVGSPRTHTLTIVDDDGPAVSFASASQSAGEGAGTRNVEVTLEEAPASDITLAYTVDGTATAGSDYAALSGTVAVPKDATTATIPVTIIDDTVREGNETIVLTLTGGAGYRVGSPGTHTLTIVNPVVGISVSSPAPVPGNYGCNGGTWGPKVTEGEPVVFTLTARPAPDTPLPVNLRIVSNVLDPSKVRNVRETRTQKTIAIPAGQTSVTYTVPTVDDDVVRTYIGRGGRTLGGWIDVTILPSWEGEGYTRDTHSCSVLVTVLDNDGPVLAMHAKTNKVVAGDPAMFTIKADLAPTEDLEVSVLWESYNRRSTASYGHKTIAFPAGRSSVTFPVETASNPRDPWRVVRARFLPSSESSTGGYDLDPDRLEEYVNLHNGSGVTVTPGSGVTEGGDAVFTVKATPAPSAPLAVTLTVSQDGDYLPATAAGAHSVTIPVGGSVEYRVATDNDDTDEADGSVTVTPGAVAGYGNLGPATVVVSDDDATTVTLSTPDTTAAEGDATDTASIALTLNRGLVRGESLGVSLQFTGGTLGTDFTLSAPSPLPAGVTFLGSTVTFAGPETGQSAASITLALGAVADALTADRTVTVSIPSSSTGSAPKLEATGLGGGATGARDGDGQITLENSISNAPLVLPEVSISGGGGGTEGEAIEFFVEAAPAPVSPLTVTLAVSQDGDFVAADALGQRQVTIPVGGTATVTVATVNDEVDEADGSVTAVLEAGSDYRLGAVSTITLDIADDDPAPVVTTVVDPALVAKVRALAEQTHHGQAHVDRWRRVLVAFGVETYEGLTATTEAEANANAKKYSSPLWPRIAEVLAALEAAPVPQQQVVTLPAVSVSAGADVTEGGDAVFTVTASPAPAADLAVSVDIAADGAYGITAGKRTVTIPTTGSATLTLATTNDDTDEPDGSVTATVAAGEGYTVGDPASGSVSIQDDDEPAPVEPAVTIAAGASPVTEGGDATFTLTASPAPASPLTVSVTAAADGAYGITAGEHTVTIPTAGSATLTLATTNDDTDEPDGSVTVTLNDGEGYTVGAPASDTLSIEDDDLPPPVVTVTASTAPVTEGGDAVFTVSASRAPDADLAVTLDVADAPDSDFVAGGDEGARTVTIPDGATSVVFTLATANDEVDEPDGVVTVTLKAGEGYTVGTPASDTLSIEDDDLPPPVVSIAAKAASVTEGGAATFTLTADRAPAADLTVTLAVSETGDHVAAETEGAATAVIAKGETQAAFSVATVDDATDEPDGTVTVTLEAGAGYTVSASQGAATVTVSDDDDAMPVLSVDDVTMKEGDHASVMWFTVRLSASGQQPVEVYAQTRDSTPVSAKAGEDYWPLRATKLRFHGFKQRVAVVIYDDSHDEGSETFELVLSDARGAVIGDGVAVGTIVNDDPMPAAWLGRFGRTVAEQALDGIAGRLAAPRTAGMQGAIAGQALTFGATSGDNIGPDHAPAGSPNLGGTGSPVPSEAVRGFAGHSGRYGTGGSGHDAAGLGNGSLSPGAMSGAGATQTHVLTAREALLGSSFTLTGETDGSGGSMALWGRGSQGRFDGREGTFSLDGEVTTGMLGADYARGKWLVGLALAQSARARGSTATPKVSTPARARRRVPPMRRAWTPSCAGTRCARATARWRRR